MFGILHVHSEYSLHDSTQSPEEIVLWAKDHGYDNITLTDHGSLLGIIPFLNAGEKHHINAIPGVESYIENRQHLLLIAKNYEGFQAISKAMKEANEHQETVGRRLIFPIMGEDIRKRWLEHREDIIVTSACINGPVASVLLRGRRKAAAKKKIQQKADSLKEFAKQYSEEKKTYLSLKEKEATIRSDRTEAKKYTRKTFENRIKKAEGTPEHAKLLMQKENALNRLKMLEADAKLTAARRRDSKALLDKYKAKKDRYNSLIEKQSAIKTEKASDLYEEAKELALKYSRDYPNFFLEVQNHGLNDEAYVMPLIVKISKETGIPLIAANDAHMTYNSEECIKARQLVRFNYFDKHQDLSDGDEELYLKTEEELREALEQIITKKAAAQALENTSILGECHVVYPKDKHYPKIKEDVSFNQLLQAAKEKMVRSGEWNERYEERLAYEKEIIERMGYVDYHLIVWDFCKEAKRLGVIPKDELINMPVDFSKVDDWIRAKGFVTGAGNGPGRGSAAGSLVCYLLGITNIDPIKYDLLFERFLNPHRVSMPDIDTDVSKALRPYIIKYLKWRYGENAVCSISTETTYAAKAAVQMAGRDRSSELYDGLPKDEKEAKKRQYLQKTLKISDFIKGNDLLSEEKEFMEEFTDAESRLIWNNAKLIEGRVSGTGVHAGGIVISDNDNVNDYIPLAWKNDKKVWAAQCDMIQLEEYGLLKMDLLGLNTLDCISECLQLIEREYNKIIDINHIPFESEVFKNIYASGKTNSIFQFESAGMKNMLQRFRPTSFEDLILLVAAYRPGPMQYLDDIIEVKNGRKKPAYITGELESILEKTYGSTIYQEQVMQIFQKLAGYSLADSDNVRRYMSKKKEDKLKKERNAFVHGDQKRNIDGCVKRGISEEKANKIFDEMIEFSRYAFNKSHACAYAYVSYQTAWLKYHYPVEFQCSMLNNKPNDKYGPILEDCKSDHIKILPPSINNSFYDFTIERGMIRYGLKGIKGIGDEKSVKPIISYRSTANAERSYTSLEDFLKRAPNKKITEALILSGCFDSLYRNRKELLAAYKEKKTEIIDEEPDLSFNYKNEMDLLGAILSADPLEAYKDDAFYRCTPYSKLESGFATIFGLLIDVERSKSKNGNMKAVCRLDGKSGSIDVYFMNGGYDIPLEEYKNHVVKISGQYSGKVLFGKKIGYMSPKIKDYSFICRTKEDVEKVNEWKKEPGPNRLHVMTYIKKDKNGNLVETKTPLIAVFNVGELSGAVEEKDIGKTSLTVTSH